MNEKYVMMQKEGKYFYDSALEMTHISDMGVIANPIRTKIAKLLIDRPMYPAQIAKEIKLHEQIVYYHIKLLCNAGIIHEVDKKEIRGTTAKIYSTKNTNFIASIGSNWKPIKTITHEKKESIEKRFLNQFISDEGIFNSKIIVGSPDPHGPFKARARDGHYAIDLALFMGQYASIPNNFAVSLDVDIDPEKEENNMILVGGPVTNLVTARINEYLPAKFDAKEPWGILSKKEYIEESTGIIVRIQNPFKPQYSIIVIAGIRVSGTKSAVLGLTRHTALVLRQFNGQKKFVSIVQGFDIDGDGKIDDIEILE